MFSSAVQHAELAKCCPSPALDNMPSSNKPPNKPPKAFIDKISVTLNIQHKSHQTGLRQFVITNPQDFQTYGCLPAVKGTYKYAMRIHAPAEGSPSGSHWSKDYILMQCDPRNGKGGFVRLEWNPSRFTPAQINYFYANFCGMDLEWFHFWKGIVTRLDVAVDVPNVQIGDYLYERPKSALRVLYSKHGQPETVYLGQQAKGQCRIYDKCAEQGVGGPSLTRFEMTLKPQKPFESLTALANPFARIKVYDVLKADLGLAKLDRCLLRDAALARGLQAALGHYPSNVRSTMADAIKASTPSFWQPAMFWSEWGADVMQALPPKGLDEHKYDLYSHFEPDPLD